MFEIPRNDQKFYMLRDCRKMAGGDDHVDCKCVYLGRECLKADVEECNKNCSCLDPSSNPIFYVKKIYGARCLSVNNLFNAAGFGDKFLIHHPKAKSDVCARAETTELIKHTGKCTLNDFHEVWIWTPGNLLMNAQAKKCLQTKQNPKNEFLQLSLTKCNSSELVQKWRCNDMLWWGVSLLSGSTNITHAIRYFAKAKDKKLSARNIKKEVNNGNIWTVFPTKNQSICTARHDEGSFYLNAENMEISQIDMVPLCPHGTCSKKLLMSMNSDNLSNCTMLWEEDYSENCRPFSIENREDGFYLKWESNPYTKLGGRTLDLTIECIRNNSKFEEYLFRLRVKDIVFEQGNPFILQEDSIVDLDKNCMGNMCLKKISELPTPYKEKTVCVIQWKESTLSRLDGTSIVIKNFTKLFSVENNKEGIIILKWNLPDARLLANITFNLTILCYNDEHENFTMVKKTFFAFQTRYGFIPELTSSKNSADKTNLYLAIILPIIFVILIVLVLIITLWIYRRKQRIKESTSKHNLHSNIENQYSNGGAISNALELNSNGIECKSVDNPVYEQCAEKKNPAVTIARNRIYECFHEKSATADSDIYEIPLENIKVRQNQFYEATTPKHSPKPKSHQLKKPDSKSNLKPSPKPSPRSSPKQGPKPQPVKTPSRPPHYKVPKVQHDEEQDLYDQPLGFIPSSRKNSEVIKDEIPLQDLEDTRVVSVYEKPLPDSPQESGIYEYATREDLPTSPNYCPAEKPFEFTTDHGGSLTSNGSMYDAPHYDVLEKN